MKLLVFALLVVAVVGLKMPTKVQMQAVANAAQDAVRLQGVMDDMPALCLHKINTDVAAHYPHCFEEVEMLQNRTHWTQATASAFCETNHCLGFLDGAIGVMSTASECLVPDPAPHRPAMLKLFMAARAQVCVSRDGRYCMPMMMNMGSLVPDFEHQQVTPELMLAGICHPCMGPVVEMVRIREQQDGENKTITGMITAMVSVMCRRNPLNGQFCLPGIQQLQMEINASEALPPNTEPYVTAWKNLLPKVCGDPCFKDFLIGMAMIGIDDKEDGEGPEGGLARVMSFCVRDPNPPTPTTPSFCMLRMLDKQRDLGWKQGCLTPMDLANPYHNATCSAECGLLFQHLVNETGCCATSLTVNSAPIVRANALEYAHACGTEWPTVKECIARVQLALRVIVFRNLRYDWVMTHRLLVEMSMKRDFAAAFKVMPEDITLEFTKLQHRGIVSLQADEPIVGTSVTPKVNANADQQSSIETTSQTNLVFPSLSGTLTPDAAVDPTKPASDADPNNGATTTLVSFTVLVFAALAALL